MVEPGIEPYISALTPSGQRNCASWASQPQKSVTLRHSQEGDQESSYELVVALEKKMGELIINLLEFERNG